MKKAVVAAFALVLVAAAGLWFFMDSRYRALESERDRLATQQSKLVQDNAWLDSELAGLRSKAVALATGRDSLLTQGVAWRRDRDALAAERDSLRLAQTEAASHYDTLVSKLSQEVEQGHLQIKQYENMLTVDVADKIFFDSGSAQIKESGATVLRKVGEALAMYPDKMIRVVGHTDNVPLSRTAQQTFSTNWELSAARATTVVRFLQDGCGITPERLVAVGRGPYQPVASNSTPGGRQKNRRIEIMLLDRSLVDGTAPVADSP